MAGYSPNLKSAFALSLDQLCDEFLVIKRNYFTSRGKPGWSPLKESTIRKKQKTAPAYVTSFNIETGKLRDSIDISWQWTNRGVRITVQVKDDLALVNYLTKTLGRDFLTIDKPEKQFLINRFKRLLSINVGAS